MTVENHMGLFWEILSAKGTQYLPVERGQSQREALNELGVLVPWVVNQVYGIGTANNGKWLYVVSH